MVPMNGESKGIPETVKYSFDLMIHKKTKRRKV